MFRGSVRESRTGAMYTSEPFHENDRGLGDKRGGIHRRYYGWSVLSVVLVTCTSGSRSARRVPESFVTEEQDSLSTTVDPPPDPGVVRPVVDTYSSRVGGGLEVVHVSGHERLSVRMGLSLSATNPTFQPRRRSLECVSVDKGTATEGVSPGPCGPGPNIRKETGMVVTSHLPDTLTLGHLRHGPLSVPFDSSSSQKDCLQVGSEEGRKYGSGVDGARVRGHLQVRVRDQLGLPY